MVKRYRAHSVEVVEIVLVRVIVSMPCNYIEGAVILLVNKIFALETCKYTPHQFWVNDVCVFNISCLWCKEVSFVRETIRTNGT